MTTIAWDGQTLAADRQCSYHCMPKTKIFRLSDGSLIGFSGNAATGLEVRDWLNGGGEKPIFDSENNTDYLRIIQDGSITKCYNLRAPLPVLLPYFAIGSGSDYALGALAAGATSEQAVEIATRFDENTGGGIDTLRLGSPP